MATLCFQSPLKPSTYFPSKSNLSLPIVTKVSIFRCRGSVQTIVATEPEPVFASVKTFAPATVANLGPGFDFLGSAVDGLGDHVTLRVDSSVHTGEIPISEISGTTTKLSTNPLFNSAGIAAIATMKTLGIRSVGLFLSLDKGLPLGSGLGSRAASAAPAAVAVNEIFRKKLGNHKLVLAGLQSEAEVSGYHADNIVLWFQIEKEK